MDMSDLDNQIHDCQNRESSIDNHSNITKPLWWIWCSKCKCAVMSRRWAGHHRSEHYQNRPYVSEEVIKEDKIELEFQSSEHIKNLLDGSNTTFSELMELSNSNVEIANRLKEWLLKKHFNIDQTLPLSRKRKFQNYQSEVHNSTELITTINNTNLISESILLQDVHQHDIENETALLQCELISESLYFEEPSILEVVSECTYQSLQCEASKSSIPDFVRTRTCHPDFENPFGDGNGLTGQRKRMYQMGLYDRIKLRSSSVLKLLFERLSNKLKLNEKRCMFIINRCAQIFGFIRRESKIPSLMEYGYDISFYDIVSNKDLIVQFLEEVESIYTSDCRYNYENALQQFADLVYSTKEVPVRVNNAMYSFHQMLAVSCSYSKSASDKRRYSKRFDKSRPSISYDEIVSMFECEQIQSKAIEIITKNARSISFSDAIFYVPYIAGRFVLPTGNRFEAAYNLTVTDWDNKISCQPDGFCVPVSVTKQGVIHGVPISCQLAKEMQFYFEKIRPKCIKNNSGPSTDSASYFFLNTNGSQFITIGASFRFWQLKHFDGVRSFTIGCNLARHVITTYRKNLRLTHIEYVDIGAILGNSDPVQHKHYTDCVHPCTVRGLMAINSLFRGQPAIDCNTATPEDFDQADPILDVCEDSCNLSVCNHNDDIASHFPEIQLSNNSCDNVCEVNNCDNSRSIDNPSSESNGGSISFRLLKENLDSQSIEEQREVQGPFGLPLKNDVPITYTMTPVEQLIRARFQLFPCLKIVQNLPGRGTGVYSTQFIPNGSWVANYQGIWVFDIVHNNKIAILKKTDIKQAEIIQMYRLHIPSLRMFIEAHYESRISGIPSIGRLFNHSCIHANVEPIQRHIKLPDGSEIKDILFRAIKDIQEGEEIFWYYGHSTDFDNADWWSKCWCKGCSGKSHVNLCKANSFQPPFLAQVPSENAITSVPAIREGQMSMKSESQGHYFGKSWCGVDGFRLYYTDRHRRNILMVQDVPGKGNLCAVESIYRALVSASVIISWDEVYSGLLNASTNDEKDNFEIITVINFLIRLGNPFAFIYAPKANPSATIWVNNVTNRIMASKIAGIVFLGDHYMYTVPFEHPGSEPLKRRINWTKFREIKDLLLEPVL